MDSLCLAWSRRPEVAITIDYGQQPAAAEIAASAAACQQLKITHHVLQVDCRALGSGDLAGGIANPHAPTSDWWPYRNQLLITLAAMKAISLGVNRLLIGTVQSDNSHHDGTGAFVNAISSLLALQEGDMTVEAPAIGMSTTELARQSGIPAGVLAWAHSCHKADVPCGSCRGCNKYFQTMRELGYGLA